MISDHTIPSLSGTFGIPTRLTLNPKIPKEPSSPSHANSRIEKQLQFGLMDRKRKYGQRTTRAHKKLPHGSEFKGCSPH